MIFDILSNVLKFLIVPNVRISTWVYLSVEYLEYKTTFLVGARKLIKHKQRKNLLIVVVAKIKPDIH